MKAGGSVLSKGLSLDQFELQDLIANCEDPDTIESDIKEYVDENLRLSDLFVCIDGTYVS